MRIKTNLFSTTILCRGIDEEFSAIYRTVRAAEWL